MSKLFGVPRIGYGMHDYGDYIIVDADNEEEVICKIRKKTEEIDDYHDYDKKAFIAFLESAKEGNIYELGDIWEGEWA